MYKTIEECRLCGSKHLDFLYSLGNQYVSDFPKSLLDVKKAHQVPIDIVLCPKCTLVQQKHTAPQDFMYTRHYWYRSGINATMTESLKELAGAIMNVVAVGKNDIVLDIGSNDGTLLRSYPESVRATSITVGVEPAVNLLEVGSQGIDVFISDFWSAESYHTAMNDWLSRHSGWSSGKTPLCKVVTAIGMFYDLDDPTSFIGDIKNCLAHDGVFVAQLMCLKNMLNQYDIGNFAHEHLEFYSLRSLKYLFDKFDLEMFSVETNSVNGESYRIFVKHKDCDKYPVRANVAEHFLQEAYLHVHHLHYEFFRRLGENKRAVVNFIEKLVSDGKLVWGYGASTKGNVILQYYGLNERLIKGIADRSPEKWGRYTVGTGIPIFAESTARSVNPDYFFVLPYGFVQEFVERERTWRLRGGKFIVPLPSLTVV